MVYKPTYNWGGTTLFWWGKLSDLQKFGYFLVIIFGDSHPLMMENLDFYQSVDMFGTCYDMFLLERFRWENNGQQQINIIIRTVSDSHHQNYPFERRDINTQVISFMDHGLSWNSLRSYPDWVSGAFSRQDPVKKIPGVEAMFFTVQHDTRNRIIGTSNHLPSHDQSWS